DPTDLTAERVADTVLDVLAQDPGYQAQHRPDLKGLDTAAELLLSLLPASAVSTMSDTQEMSEMDLLKRTEDREPVLNKSLALSEANGEAKELRAERPILSPQPS